MHPSPQQFYESRVEDFSNQSVQLAKKIIKISFLRLAAFLCIVVALVLLTLLEIKSIAVFFIVLAIVVFLFLVKYHLGLEKKKKQVDKLLEINKNELEYLNLNYSKHHNASNHIDTNHPYTSDLTIFGDASLFQYINRTVTSYGEKRLVYQLSQCITDKQVILDKQEACRELSAKPEWRQEFQAVGGININNSADIANIQEWLNQPSEYLQKKKLLFVLRYLPYLSFVCLVAGFITGIYIIAEMLYSFQIIIVLYYTRNVNKVHEKLTSKYELLQNYSNLMQCVEQENFKSNVILLAQRVLTGNKESAANELKLLSKILNAFDRRLNLLAAFFLNTLYMSDLVSVVRLEKWKEANRSKIQLWFDALGQIDAMASFGCFAFNNQSYAYPALSDKIIIEGTQIGHPQIPNGKRVCNDFKIPHNGYYVILTGANMAGKSTFLRTVAINIVLGMNGAPVCAKDFSFKPLPLMTSISVKDSLFENESYFYAELKRLSNIVKELQSGKEIFIVLDEILKGTNSNDKLKGSQSLMKKLVKLNGSGIVATHDILLGELEMQFPENIHNQSFEVALENDFLFYDYKLHNGVCKNLNASFLMKKMGIID